MMCTDIGLLPGVLGGDGVSAAKGYLGSEKRRSWYASSRPTGPAPTMRTSVSISFGGGKGGAAILAGDPGVSLA